VERGEVEAPQHARGSKQGEEVGDFGWSIVALAEADKRSPMSQGVSRAKAGEYLFNPVPGC
jgi:hypothetical protein